MGKTKTTLDTNVLISALGWKGSPNRVFEKIVAGEIELVMSEEQFGELGLVLDYPKFKFTIEQKDRFKALILKAATFVKPKEKVTLIEEDPADDRILESALAGKVNYIVTGDRHLLKLKQFRGIRIVTPREFLDEMKY